MKRFLAYILILFVFSGVPAQAQTKAKSIKTSAAATASRYGNTYGNNRRTA